MPFSADYETLKILGVGACGVVRLAREKKSGRLTALKQCRRDGDVHQMMTERAILVKSREDLSHSPYIVDLYAAFQTGDFLFLSLEFMAGGDLMSHMIRRHVFPETQAKYIFKQLILAIDYLHSSLQYIHCDIKPDHLMFSVGDYPTVKLVDFGLSRPLANAPYFGLVGTPDYMAPDIYSEAGLGWSAEVDLWSAGCVLFEMLFGGPPFSDLTHNPEITKQRVLNHNTSLVIPATDRPISFACRSMLEGLLAARNDRLNMTLIKLHAFLNDIVYSGGSGGGGSGGGSFTPQLTQAAEVAEFFDAPDQAQLQEHLHITGGRSFETLPQFDWTESSLQDRSDRRETAHPRLACGRMHALMEDDDGEGRDSNLSRAASPKENSTYMRFLANSFRVEKSKTRTVSFHYQPVQNIKPLFGRASLSSRIPSVNLRAPVQPLIMPERYMWH